MKPGAGRTTKVTERQKRLIKLQQAQDDTLSLTDLVRFALTDLNLTITRQTVSRILRDFDMVSYIAPRKPRITLAQRCPRVACSYEHLSWSVNQCSNDESNGSTKIGRMKIGRTKISRRKLVDTKIGRNENWSKRKLVDTKIGRYENWSIRKLVVAKISGCEN